MLRKTLFIVFCLAIATFMLLVSVYFLHQGKEWARFSDEPSKTANAYATKPVHFEVTSARSNKWHRGNVEFLTEDNRPVLLQNYAVNTAERDILMRGGSITLQYLVAEPQIVKKTDNNDGVFWAYAVALSSFICGVLACWSMFSVFRKKSP